MKFEELPEQLQAVISPIRLQSDHVQLLSDVWDGKDEDGRIDMVELFGSRQGQLERDSLILRLSQSLLH